jgi:hypothetical protein
LPRVTIVRLADGRIRLLGLRERPADRPPFDFDRLPAGRIVIDDAIIVFENIFWEQQVAGDFRVRFGNQAPEEVAPYDQPVLVRLNTRDEFELRAGFPRVPEELYSYHAVIIDDLEARRGSIFVMIQTINSTRLADGFLPAPNDYAKNPVIQHVKNHWTPVEKSKYFVVYQ